MYATQEVADDVHGHEHEPSDDDIDSARTNLESESEDERVSEFVKRVFLVQQTKQCTTLRIYIS